jgi:hypothetical protein
MGGKVEVLKELVTLRGGSVVVGASGRIGVGDRIDILSFLLEETGFEGVDITGSEGKGGNNVDGASETDFFSCLGEVIVFPFEIEAIGVIAGRIEIIAGKELLETLGAVGGEGVLVEFVSGESKTAGIEGVDADRGAKTGNGADIGKGFKAGNGVRKDGNAGSVFSDGKGFVVSEEFKLGNGGKPLFIFNKIKN